MKNKQLNDIFSFPKCPPSIPNDLLGFVYNTKFLRAFSRRNLFECCWGL